MRSSVRILVIIIVMTLTQVNARRWQHITRRNLLNTKKMSKPSFVHRSSAITTLSTKEHTTILAKVKKRLTTATTPLTFQTSTPTPKFTSINDLRKTSKLTTALLSRKNPEHTKAISTRIPEATTISTSRQIAEFTTLHAVKSTSVIITKLESKPKFKKTLALETRPVFTTINVQHTGTKKRPSLRQAVERETIHPFSRTHAITTILLPKHTSAVSPIMRPTTGHTSNVARRVPEFTTLHDYTLKSGLTTKLSTGHTTEPTRITTILSARRIPEQTQRRKTESTNTLKLGKHHKLIARAGLEQTPEFTTTYGPRFTTKTVLRQESKTKASPASNRYVEFKSMSPTTIEAKISPVPRIKTTLKETLANITKFNRTLGFNKRLTPKLKPVAITVHLTKTHRLNSKAASGQTFRPTTRSVSKQTRGNKITPTYKKPKFINRLGLRTKPKPRFSKKHSVVTKTPISWVSRYVNIHSHKAMPTYTTKFVFTYRPSAILTPRSTTRSTDRQTDVFKTELAFRYSSGPIIRHLNTTEHIDRLESIPAPISESVTTQTSESVTTQTVDPSTEYEVTQPEISTISTEIDTKSVEPSQTPGFVFNQEFGFTLGSKPSEATGFAAESTTMEKNVNNQLYVGVWRPWFTPDGNPDQGFALGFTEDFSPGYDNARVLGIDTETPDITQTTVSENLIDEILKLIEELNQNSTTNSYSVIDSDGLSIQNVTIPMYGNITHYESMDESNVE